MATRRGVHVGAIRETAEILNAAAGRIEANESVEEQLDALEMLGDAFRNVANAMIEQTKLLREEVEV